MAPTALPALPYDDWEPSKTTLHLFCQIVGKIRLGAHPKLNHWWHVTLYVTPRGLTTGLIPHAGGGFAIDLDLREPACELRTTDGGERFAIEALSVADFHDRLTAALAQHGIRVPILARPYEHASTTPFAEDRAHAGLDTPAVRRYHRALLWIAGVFERFRGRFTGKSTPVHLFWHSFDLALTRFSGREAPPMDGGTPSDREAYSHEVISVGFWPGDPTVREPCFYAYAHPEPAGLADGPLEPAAAAWVEQRGSHIGLLRYHELRESDHPDRDLLAFLESAYRGAAERAGWDVDRFRNRFLED